MAFKPPKIILPFLACAFIFAGCSDFRAVFNGKPQAKVAKKSKPRTTTQEKKRYQPIPQDAERFFDWPLTAPVSSTYGKRNGRFHDGIDIDGEKGDPVVAAAEGDVVFSGNLGAYGQLIVLRHNNGLFTAYAHNEKIFVKKGERVKKGDHIANVGQSGSASGDHLHFEIRDQKGTYDPLDFLPQQRYSQKP